jgi:hypothetical protein
MTDRKAEENSLLSDYMHSDHNNEKEEKGCFGLLF